ncbi:MAG: GIY-YIG nuclease family protein [Phycisphaerae bacterium]
MQKPGQQQFSVYVLQNPSGRFYVGHTCDLNRRLVEHNSPNHNPSKCTSRQSGPWQLIYQEHHPNRSEAMHRERWLKSGAGR